jgi:hypothetical protein
MDSPKLRSLQFFPIRMSGQTMICIQDPLHLSEKTLVLPSPLYFVLSHFDGQHSIVDIQANYMRQFGEFLFTEKIEELIRQLDENLFFEGERFQEALRKREEEFRRAPIREAVFAGKSYERDPEPLRMQLEACFREPGGPGIVRGARRAGKVLKGVIAPHIDFQRGGSCYAFAHREIAAEDVSRCFIIFGTAHSEMALPFALTRKDFATPLGTLKVDGELLDAIHSRCSGDYFRDEKVHQWEHSIEFQCLFLRYLFPEPISLKIVPILSGSLQEAIEKSISPMELEPVREFVEGLRDAVSFIGKEVCYLASADLSHVGQQFGDPEGIREYGLRALEEEDREMLGYLERLDGEGFFASVSRERDRRRICGLSAIYSLLSVVGAGEGRLLKYGQAYTPETRSAVSFASMAFY